MKWHGLWTALLFLATSLVATAQLQVSAQTQRSNYLLYERVDVLVTITNLGGMDLELSNDGGHPWLSFMVQGQQFGRSYLPVHSERQGSFAAVTLKAGEAKTLRVNITPLYAFREEGNYRVAAVVNLPGAGEMVSDLVPFNIERGHILTSQVHAVENSERTYSLVRFSPTSDLTKLYLRVEDPADNLVYTNLALGELVASTDPTVMFDPLGNIHVLQPTALGTYLYSRADPDGKVLDQRVFKVTKLGVRPRLLKTQDGNVVVMGGTVQDPSAVTEKLSETQHGIAVPSPVPSSRANETAPRSGSSAEAPLPVAAPAAEPSAQSAPGP